MSVQPVGVPLHIAEGGSRLDQVLRASLDLVVSREIPVTLHVLHDELHEDLERLALATPSRRPPRADQRDAPCHPPPPRIEPPKPSARRGRTAPGWESVADRRPDVVPSSTGSGAG